MLATAALVAAWCPEAGAVTDHGLGPGYRWTHLSAEGSSPVDLHSAALQYSVFTGSRFGFVLVAEALFPLQGYQQGHGFWLPSTYDTATGLDLLLGGGVRFRLSERWSLWTGLGPHLDGLKLTQQELRSFNSLTLGVGAVAAPRWQVLPWLDLGANVSTALDFRDLIHTTHSLSWGSHLGLSVLASIRLDRISDDPAVRDPEAPTAQGASAAPGGGTP